MKYTTYFLLLPFLLCTCGKRERAIEKIDFKTPYGFSSEIENRLANDTTPWKHQFSAVEYAQKADYRKALQEWDAAMGYREVNYSENQIDSINKLYSKVNARKYILDQAKEHQIIIINEAHHNSLHRVFTKSLLEELHSLGYTHLGLEALATSDSLNSALNTRKYPIQESGHYIKEPQFGNMVREALALGYTVFSYDTITRGDQSLREITEARNIEQVVEANPGGKFLIHCGYAHVMEGKDTNWVVTMAERLKKFTGIDPLTISQTSYTERGNPDFNHPLLKALDIDEPTILLDQQNNPLTYNQNGAYADLAIFHPSSNDMDGRPAWLFKNGNRNVSIDLSEVAIDYPVMVLAYKKGEDINSAVPVDMTEVDQPASCTLGLVKGDYEIVVTNGTKSYKFDREVK